MRCVSLIGLAVVAALTSANLGCGSTRVASQASAPPGTEQNPIVLNVLPSLGEPFQPAIGSSNFEMTSSASFDPAAYVVVDRVAFVIAVGSDGRVKYVGTTDARFETPEGIRVGSSLQAVLSLGAALPVAERGWGLHTVLPSGWSVGLFNGASLSEEPLPPGSKVSLVFMRR